MDHSIIKLKYFLAFIIISFFTTTKAQQYSPKQIDSLAKSVITIPDKKKALQLGLECYKLSDQINYGKGKMQSLHSIILIYSFMGNDEKVIEFSDKLQDLGEKENNYFYQIKALISKAYSYGYSSFYKKADTTIEEAISIASHLKNDDFNMLMGDIYQCKAEIENIKINSSENLVNNKKSLSYYLKIKNLKKKQSALSTQYYNLAYSYLDCGKKDSAIYCNRVAINLSKKNNNPVNEGMALYGMANTYFELDQKDSAIYYFKKSLPFLDKINDPYKMQYLYEDMALIYEKMGDTKNYIYYNKKSLELLNTNANAKKMMIDDIANQILIDEKKDWNQQFYIILITITLAVLLIIIFTIKLFRENSKTKAQKKKTEINLFESDQKVSQLKLQVNDAFDEILELAKADNPAFLSRFREVYPEFYNNLVSNHSHLTISQLRFCAMLKLNFSTKEIAHYHHLSIKGIQVKKNRLRKLLDIPSDIDLNKWMMEL